MCCLNSCLFAALMFKGVVSFVNKYLLVKCVVEKNEENCSSFLFVLATLC